MAGAQHLQMWSTAYRTVQKYAGPRTVECSWKMDTDRQTGLLTATVAIPKQTRLKPASLIVRYKAPTYLILLLFSF